MNESTIEKINALAALVEKQQIERLHEQDLACPANLQNAKTKVVPGRKYTKIDVGNSGKLMIENESEIIYGIKGYGVVHKGHQYGNLDTTAQFFWGDFRPKKI